MTTTIPNAPFFLTEFISLDTRQLHQRGILLHSEHRAFIHNGPYSAKTHFDWIEDRRLNCEKRGWLATDIAQYGGDQLILEGKDLNFPNNLMELIWKLTESPTGTPFSDIKFGINKSLISFSENQLPFISWLNKIELNRIAERLKDLEPNKGNPVGKTLWDHANLVKDVLEGWFIRNSVDIPRIEYPGTQLSDWTKFFELVKEALECGRQTEDQLFDWKTRFDDFHSNYFTKFENQIGAFPQGLGSNNGLEWRKNSKFRKPRIKKSGK